MENQIQVAIMHDIIEIVSDDETSPGERKNEGGLLGGGSVGSFGQLDQKEGGKTGSPTSSSPLFGLLNKYDDGTKIGVNNGSKDTYVSPVASRRVQVPSKPVSAPVASLFDSSEEDETNLEFPKSSQNDVILILSDEEEEQVQSQKSQSKRIMPPPSSSPVKKAKIIKMPQFVDISEDTLDESDFSFTRSQKGDQSKGDHSSTHSVGEVKASNSQVPGPKKNTKTTTSKPKRTTSKSKTTTTKSNSIVSPPQAIPSIDFSQYDPIRLKAVNKIKREREEFMVEMIIYLPESLYTTAINTTKEITKKDPEGNNIQVIVPMFEEATVLQACTTGPEIVWKRKVDADYDVQNDLFLPCDKKEITEDASVVYYDAETFVSRLMNNQVFLQPKTIVLVESLPKLLSKVSNQENKVYKDQVLGKSTTSTDPEYTVKQIEHKLNELEFTQKVNMLPVRTQQEILEWLVSFTYTLGFSRYDRAERNVQYSNLVSVKGSTYKETFLEILNKFRYMPLPKRERLYVYYNGLYKIYQQLVRGSLGDDDWGSRLVPESAEGAMKVVFGSEDPGEVIYK